MLKQFTLFLLLLIGLKSLGQDIAPPRGSIRVLLDIDKKQNGSYHVKTNTGDAYFDIVRSEPINFKSFIYELKNDNDILIRIYKKNFLGGYKEIDVVDLTYNKTMDFMVLKFTSIDNKKVFKCTWLNADSIDNFNPIKSIAINPYIGCIRWH